MSTWLLAVNFCAIGSILGAGVVAYFLLHSDPPTTPPTPRPVKKRAKPFTSQREM